jgi:uncharacterized damage-inducible protein DinB
MENTEKLKYPIGKYVPREVYTNEDIEKGTKIIMELAEKLHKAVENLDDKHLDTRYRDGGWTIRQVVHHIADSHANAYIRFRLALTEETPVVKPYFEAEWAELSDAKTLPVEVSIKLIDALHTRWVSLITSLKLDELKRNFFHPEQHKVLSLDYIIDIYAWHCEHHLAQIVNLINRMKW